MRWSMFFPVAIMIMIQTKMCTCTPSGLLYVLPDNSTNASCPSQPCATLSQYLMNMSGMSNVKLLFLSGEHSLTSNTTMHHLYNVTMVGVDSQYQNIVPAKIVCQSAEAVLIFVNASNIMITNLVFKNFGGITALPLYPFGTSEHLSALFFDTCYYCKVTNTTFIGYGLVANNLLGESHLDNITLHLHKTDYSSPNRCNRGMIIMNDGDSPYKSIVDHSLMFVRKITIIVSPQ